MFRYPSRCASRAATPYYRLRNPARCAPRAATLYPSRCSSMATTSNFRLRNKARCSSSAATTDYRLRNTSRCATRAATSGYRFRNPTSTVPGTSRWIIFVPSLATECPTGNEEKLSSSQSVSVPANNSNVTLFLSISIGIFCVGRTLR